MITETLCEAGTKDELVAKHGKEALGWDTDCSGNPNPAGVIVPLCTSTWGYIAEIYVGQACYCYAALDGSRRYYSGVGKYQKPENIDDIGQYVWLHPDLIQINENTRREQLISKV